MTCFAPVCGIQMYEQMYENDELPNYLLLLAHDVDARSARYNDLFGLVRNPHRVTIMDNSITELGSAIGQDVCIRAAKAAYANVLVLPDVYEDGEATVKAITEAYPQWEEDADANLGWEWSFMAVPQGKTLAEFAYCAEQLANASKFKNIHWWGIPRNLVKNVGTRREAIKICAMLAPWRAIHMLGFSDNILDDILCARGHGHNVPIQGIDSAVPMRCSATASSVPLRFTLGLGEMPKRPENWLEQALLTNEVRADWYSAAQYIEGP